MTYSTHSGFPETDKHARDMILRQMALVTHALVFIIGIFTRCLTSAPSGSFVLHMPGLSIFRYSWLNVENPLAPVSELT